MNSRVPVATLFALSTITTGCNFLGGSQAGESAQKDLVPQGGIVAAHLSPAKGNYVSQVTVAGLPPARYALFLSQSPFASSASLLAFDVDAKCGQAHDGGTGDASVVPQEQQADCTANGLTSDGTTVSVLVFQGEAASANSTVEGVTRDLNVALRALEGKTLPAKVTLTAFDLTIGTQDEANAPGIDPVTLP